MVPFLASVLVSSVGTAYTPCLSSLSCKHSSVWGGEERSVTGRLPNGAGLVHMGGWYADTDLRIPKL